jgi:exodeoxyribonuclease-5
MEYTPQQEKALEEIRRWLPRAAAGDAPLVYRLFGYAGTGKTTIAKAARGMAPRVQYVSLTGKAALVLRGKGCDGAKTIHSTIYRAMDKSQTERDRMAARVQQLIAANAPEEDIKRAQFELDEMNKDLNRPMFSFNEHAFDREWVEDEYHPQGGYMQNIEPPSLLVVDECSMIDRRIGQDLERFRIPLLVLGDPAQLPPVSGGGYWTGTKDNPVRPDTLLSEIHRQAADNPIVTIATAIRTRGMPPDGEYGESRIGSRTMLSQEEWLEADQILSGRNVTRTSINNRIRQLQGFEGFLPQPEERLVCLRNNHDKGLLNGSMWEVVHAEDCPKEDFFSLEVQSLDDEDRPPVVTLCHKKPFMGMAFEDIFERRSADEFDFGYCITTHKAQGSEWPNVVYVDEWPGSDRKKHQYTGVTRAAQRISVVKW